MDGRPLRFAWIALLGLALAVRLVAGVWWQQRLPSGQHFFFPDSNSYWELGRSLAHGEPYRYGEEEARIFRTPGYPLLLSPLFKWLGEQPSPLWARLLSAICGTCSVALVFQWTKSIFNESAAWLAGAWAAFDPGSISQGVFVLSEAPFCPLMLLQLWLWWLAEQSPHTATSLRWAGASGFVAGLATLMRPSWLLFLPFALFAGCIVMPNRVRHSQLVLTMCVTCALAMSPWWWRNYQLTGRFVPTTLQVGASLYDGLHPNATGGSEMSFVKTFLAEQRAIDAASSTPLSNSFEERLNDRMFQAALQWAQTHPQRVLELAAIKFWRMWTPWPNASDVGGFWPKLALALGYLPVMCVLIANLPALWKQERHWHLLLWPAIYFTLLHGVFVGSVRYRQPAMLPLMILAAGCFQQQFSWLGSRTQQAVMEPDGRA